MTIYALALGSNLNREHWIAFARQQLTMLGECQWSPVYEIPCRAGKGADYYNLAVLLDSPLVIADMEQRLQQLEQQAGRIRPSHCISLDIDMIAYGDSLQQMQLVAKKLPLAFDVWLPLSALWRDCPGSTEKNRFKILNEALK